MLKRADLYSYLSSFRLGKAWTSERIVGIQLTVNSSICKWTFFKPDTECRRSRRKKPSPDESRELCKYYNITYSIECSYNNI